MPGRAKAPVFTPAHPTRPRVRASAMSAIDARQLAHRGWTVGSNAPPIAVKRVAQPDQIMSPRPAGRFQVAQRGVLPVQTEDVLKPRHFRSASKTSWPIRPGPSDNRRAGPAGDGASARAQAGGCGRRRNRHEPAPAENGHAHRRGHDRLHRTGRPRPFSMHVFTLVDHLTAQAQDAFVGIDATQRVDRVDRTFLVAQAAFLAALRAAASRTASAWRQGSPVQRPADRGTGNRNVR